MPAGLSAIFGRSGNSYLWIVFDAADHVVEDFYRAFGQLAEMPGMGHKRKDLTSQKVLFWPVHSYLVVYKDSRPLRIARVIHGRRDVKKILRKC